MEKRSNLLQHLRSTVLFTVRVLYCFHGIPYEHVQYVDMLSCSSVTLTTSSFLDSLAILLFVKKLKALYDVSPTRLYGVSPMYDFSQKKIFA